MSTELIILRGIPASGKTTWAREWLAEDPRRARVSRDDIRAQLFGASGEHYAPYFKRDDLYECEKLVTVIEEKTAKELLRTRSVVIDATHIKASYIRRWLELAAKLGISSSVKLFDPDLDTCLMRDRGRDWPVGDDLVRAMYGRLRSAVREPLPIPQQKPAAETLYVPNIDLPAAWLVDIDGTLALMNGRSPYDTTRYHEDVLNEPVATVATSLHDVGFEIVVMSGRDDEFYEATSSWLRHHHIPHDALFMRPRGDRRNDAVVKLELFWEHVAPAWNVMGCLDDRDRVVDAWRSIGLTCLQVAPGDF